MGNILNITNGDNAIEIMKTANIPGEFLPWRDVLHDGPVPKDLSLEELSQIRAEFIIDRCWGTPEIVNHHFFERDNALKSFEKYAKVILWFEHDLYDQLQILQVLDWFHQHKQEATILSLICVDQYLGTLSPDQMALLVKYEEPVTEDHLELASKAWSAFRSDTPENWRALLETDTAPLPFLGGAIVRLMEEYPSCANGLSRTAHKALEIVSQGEKLPGKVFACYQESEERRFMGDAGFWVILHEFLESSPPLLKLPAGRKLSLSTSTDQELTLTPEGKDVLAGKRNWLEIIELDRWIGGVHLTPDNTWCWDSNMGMVVKEV